MNVKRCLKKQSGVALLTVLALIATMSAIAVGISTQMHKATMRRLAINAQNHLRWHAYAVELLAFDVIRQQARMALGKDTMQEAWLKTPQVFPIENGTLSAQITDSTRCFNVNSLVQPHEEGWVADAENIARYITLLTNIGFSESGAVRLADTLVDWIDTDTIPSQNGAEDFDYAGLAPPYRTGGTLLGDVSELRVIHGYQGAVYRYVQPYLCAHSTTAPSPVNVNLLLPTQAVLLHAMFAGAVDIDRIKNLIAERPAQGYATIDAFWQHPALEEVPPDATIRTIPRLWSRYLQLKATIQSGTHIMEMQSDLDVLETGSGVVVRRRFGAV